MSYENDERKVARRHLIKWALKRWGWPTPAFTKTQVVSGSRVWCQEKFIQHVLNGGGASGCACGKCPGA